MLALIFHTFRFNIKYSFLELLCTLARLCEETSLQQRRLNSFEIDFPLHIPSQLPFLTCSRQDTRTRGKTHRSNEWDPLFTANQSAHPRYILPPLTSDLSTAKVSARCAILRCRVPREECFHFVSRNRFFMKSPCYSFAIALKGNGGEGY